MPLRKGEFVVFEQTPLSEYLKEIGEEEAFFAPSPPPRYPPSPPSSTPSPSFSPPLSLSQRFLSSLQTWRRSSVEKLMGDKADLGSERCFEDYRCILENWRLTVEGNVNYTRKVKEEEVLKKVLKVISEGKNQKQRFALGGKEKAFLATLILCNWLSLRAGIAEICIAITLAIAGLLYLAGFQKEIHCHHQVMEKHKKLQHEVNLCCAMTRLFENRLSKATQMISEVELVARGYYLKSTNFSPIVRIERTTAKRKCQRLREVTLSCIQTLDASFLRGTPAFTSSYPTIPLDPCLPTSTESVELLLSFSDRLSKRGTNSPPDCPPPLSSEDLSGVEEKLSLSNLKEADRILQEHRAQFFDLIFLDASLRRKRTGNNESSSSVENCQTFEILEAVETWVKEYLQEINALNARLDHALNFQSEMSNIKIQEPKGKESAEVVRLANLLKGLTREISTRLSLIQQEIFASHEKNHDHQKFSEGVRDQLTHIEHNLKISLSNFEELKREAALLLSKDPALPQTPGVPERRPSEQSPEVPDGEQEAGPPSQIFGDVEAEGLELGEAAEALRQEVYEADPEEDERQEEEIPKPKLSREERILQRKIQQEEEKKKREEFQNKLDLVSELKSVLNKHAKQK